MNTDWEVKKLGEVSTLRSGTTLPPSLEKATGELPYLKVADMNLDENKDGISTSSRFVNKSDVSNAGIIPVGSTIFPKRGGAILTNKKRITLLPIYMDLNLMAVTASNKISSAYLFFYFLNLDLRDINNGSSIPQINNYQIEPLIISYPKSLPEQQRIVAILDEAFAAIDQAKTNAKRNLQNARELFDSYLQSVFANPGEGWEEKTFMEICENLDYKRVPITKHLRSEGKYPYYGASGIVDYVDEFIFDENLLLVSEDGANLLARTYPIAFSVTGKTWVNNHAHVLRFKDLNSQRFVEYYLNSIKLNDYVSGMAQPKLNQRMLNTIPIPYPTLEIQKEIVSSFDLLSAETKKLEAIYQQKLIDLDELKRSILQKAFRGELSKTQGDALCVC